MKQRGLNKQTNKQHTIKTEGTKQKNEQWKQRGPNKQTTQTIETEGTEQTKQTRYCS